MPKVSSVKVNSGGEMSISPVRTLPTHATISLGRLSGGSVNSKSSKRMKKNVVKLPEVSSMPMPKSQEEEAISGLSGRQLQQYLNAKNKEGRLQRNTLGTTRDVLLQEILGKIEGQEGGMMPTKSGHSNSKSRKGGMGGSGIMMGSMGGGNLDQIVKNDMRLKHLRDMGVRVDTYSPYVIKAVVDGDYKSYRTTNENEWNDLINECALRGVQVNIMGRKTQFGRQLEGFLRNGKYGGEMFNTDDMVNSDIRDGVPVHTRSGLQGGSMVADNGSLPTIRTPTIPQMIDEVIAMSINLGYNPAIDLLNTIKDNLTPQEYSDLYVYLGQTALPLR